MACSISAAHYPECISVSLCLTRIGKGKGKNPKETKKEGETEMGEGLQGIEWASVMAPGLQL